MANKHKQLKRFLRRLKRLSRKSIPSALSKLISKSDLTHIFEFFSLSEKQIKMIDSLREQAEIRFKFLYDLVNLRRGKSIRLAKEDTGLARTINIVRSESGRYQFYLETKSKLADNSKQLLPIIRGVKKVGKPVWRLGKDFTEEFNLTTRICNDLDALESELNFNEPQIKDTDELISLLKHTDEYAQLQDEFNYNQCIKHKSYIIRYFQGSSFVHHNQFKISLYCKKALGTLEDVISGNIPSTREQRLSLSEMLLKGLVAIHQENIAHQDIKPQNILIFTDKKFGLSLKISDFGLSARNLDISEDALCTPIYHSPEIAFRTVVLNHDHRDFQYFHLQEYSTHSYSNQLVYSSNKNTSFPHEYLFPHVLNDCWSAGIVLYEIFSFGCRPIKDVSDEYIAYNAVLKGLLEPERESRMTAKDAVLVFEKNKALIFSQMLDYPYQKPYSKAVLCIENPFQDEIDVLQSKLHSLVLQDATGSYSHPGPTSSKSSI
jgi:serine/threonine protein kinase